MSTSSSFFHSCSKVIKKVLQNNSLLKRLYSGLCLVLLNFIKVPLRYEMLPAGILLSIKSETRTVEGDAGITEQ